MAVASPEPMFRRQLIEVNPGQGSAEFGHVRARRSGQPLACTSGMRITLFLLLSVILCACATVEPIEVTLENVDEVTRFVPSYSEPDVTLQEQVVGEWQSVASSVALLCIGRCGQPGGPVVCADVAPPDGVWALLPGHATTFVIEGEHWVRRPAPGGACAARTGVVGEARFIVCHGAQAETWEGVPIDPPAESGLVTQQNDFVQLIDGTCDTFDVDLAEGRAVTLELAAP